MIDVKARSFLSLFTQNASIATNTTTTAASGPVPKQVDSTQQATQKLASNILDSQQNQYPPSNEFSSSNDQFYSSQDSQQAPKKKMLFDPKSNQMVEPTAVVATEHKPFSANNAAAAPGNSNKSPRTGPGYPKKAFEALQSTNSLSSAPPHISKNTNLKRKGAEDADGKWVRVAPLPSPPRPEISPTTEANESEDKNSPILEDSEQIDIQKVSTTIEQTKTRSVLARSYNPQSENHRNNSNVGRFGEFSGREASEEPPRNAPQSHVFRRDADEKKEARAKERQERGPRSKGFLFRYNSKDELEQVFTSAELAKHHEPAAHILEGEVASAPSRLSQASARSISAEEPNDVRKRNAVKEPDLANIPYDIADFGENLINLGFSDPLESRSNSSPERSRVIGQVWIESGSSNANNASNVGQLTLERIQPQQNPHAELDKSLSRPSNASLGLDDSAQDLLNPAQGVGYPLSSLALGGILPSTLIDPPPIEWYFEKSPFAICCAIF